MKPKRYPYCGNKKHSIVEAIRAFEKTWITFNFENRKQIVESSRKLNESTSKVYELLTQVHQFFSSRH